MLRVVQSTSRLQTTVGRAGVMFVILALLSAWFALPRLLRMAASISTVIGDLGSAIPLRISIRRGIRKGNPSRWPLVHIASMSNTIPVQAQSRIKYASSTYSGQLSSGETANIVEFTVP